MPSDYIPTNRQATIRRRIRTALAAYPAVQAWLTVQGQPPIDEATAYDRIVEQDRGDTVSLDPRIFLSCEPLSPVREADGFSLFAYAIVIELVKMPQDWDDAADDFSEMSDAIENISDALWQSEPDSPDRVCEIEEPPDLIAPFREDDNSDEAGQIVGYIEVTCLGFGV